MNKKILFCFLIVCALGAATTYSCSFNTGGADETWYGDPYGGFCVAHGLFAGYDATPEMSLDNPNAAFNPVIRVRHSTCFGALGCATYSRKLLSPGDCDDSFGGASSVWAAQETIGINRDGSICHSKLGVSPDKCEKQTLAICAYSSTILNCRNDLNLTGHLLKCLPIPLTPAPPPACDRVMTKAMPRLVPVSAKNGNNYFTPKIKLIMGDKLKVCKNSGINFYQAITASELSSKQYQCVSGNFDKVIMPVAEKTYDIDPYKETADTFASGGEVLNIVATPRQGEICIKADGAMLGCTKRPAISDFIVTYDSANHSLIYTTNEAKPKTWSVKVSAKSDIASNKQTIVDLFEATSMETSLFAAAVNANSAKTQLQHYRICPDKTLIDPLDPVAKCPAPQIVNAFSCGGKTFQDASNCPSGSTASTKQMQQCASSIVETNQDCPFETSPDYADDGDFICLFGYHGSNLLSLDIRNNTITPVYQGGEMFFAPSGTTNQGQPLTIDPFTMDQSVLDTFIQEASKIRIFPANNTTATGAIYEWRQQEGVNAANANRTTFFKKSDNAPLFQNPDTIMIPDPMINKLCVPNPASKKSQTPSTP